MVEQSGRFLITRQRKIGRVPLSREITVTPGYEEVVVRRRNPEMDKADVVQDIVAQEDGGLKLNTRLLSNWNPRERTLQPQVLHGQEVNGKDGKGTVLRTRLTKVVFRAVPVKS